MDVFVAFIHFLMLIYVSSSQSARVLNKLHLLNTRINTLETRMNLETMEKNEELMELSESVSHLNWTISRIYEKLEVDDWKRNAEVTDINARDMACGTQANAKHVDKIISTAFKNEKHWLRRSMDSMNAQLIKLENQLILNKVEEIDKIQSEVKHLEQVSAMLRKEVTDIKTKTLKHLQQQLQNIETERDRHSDSLNEIMAEFRNKQEEKLKKQDDQINTCTNSQKDTQLTLRNIKQDIDELKLAKSLECPDSWSRYGVFCYHFFDAVMEYLKARSICEGVGAHVVDIKDAAEMKFVMSLVGSSNFWIGLTDIEREGTWKWDRTRDVAQFQKWRPGQPDNRKGSNQDCTIAGWTNPKDKWNDQGCHHTHAFVCKK